MFLLFILYLRYTNHKHKSWWKNEKMTNEISNENPEVTITPTPKNLSTCKRHHITARFIRRKDIYLRWAEQRACGRTEDPSSLLRLQTRWWIADWWWADGWVGEQTEQRLVSRSFGIWSRKSGDDESLRVSEALNRADEANAPSRHPAPSACVCTRGQQRPLRDTRWAGKLHRRFVLCSLLLGLSSRSFQHPVAFAFSSCLCTTRFQLFLCHAPVKFSYSLHVIFLVSHLGYFPLTFGFSIYVNLMFFQRSFSVTLNHPQDRSVTGSGYSKKDKSAFFLDSQQELCVLWGKFLGLNPKKKKTCRMFSGIMPLLGWLKAGTNTF